MRNTCYFNSALQTLFHTNSLTNVLLFFENELSNIDDCFVNEYTKIMKIMKNGVVVTKNDINDFFKVFLREFPFFNNIYIQHDSFETMLCIIDHLYEVFNKCKFNYVKDIFDFHIECDLICEKCENVITNKYNQRNICIENTSKNIQDGLNSTFSNEKMDDYTCEKCKEIKCYKTYKIEKLPHVLIININSYDNYGKKVQLQTNIDRVVTINDKKYKIYASICHHGSSNNGHYTTSIIYNDDYYIIDDEVSHKLTNENAFLFMKNAYVLMYKLISDR